MQLEQDLLHLRRQHQHRQQQLLAMMQTEEQLARDLRLRGHELQAFRRRARRGPRAEARAPGRPDADRPWDLVGVPDLRAEPAPAPVILSRN